MTGRVTQVVRSRSCAFIRAADGQNVFFHASALVGARFHEIEDGVVVRFTLVPDSVSGPRAALVRIDRQTVSGKRGNGRTVSSAAD